MVRVVQVDDSVQQYVDQRMLRRAQAEVGVLAGRSAGGKDFVLQLVCCPDQDGEPPISVKPGGAAAVAAPKRGGTRGKPAPGGGLELDREWVVEHARQVSRLLPGGLDVLGLYLLCPESSFAGAAAAVAAVLTEAAAEAGGGQGAAIALHADAVTAKLSARELSAGALRPCEVKVSSLLPSMVSVRCRYPLDVTLHAANARQEVHDAVRDAMRWEGRHKVGPALGLVDGQLQPAERPIADVANGGAPLTVELLVPPFVAVPAAVGLAKGVLQRGVGTYQAAGHVALSGVLDCRAFVHRREPAVAAVAAIKADIERSLQARLEVLVDAADMATAVKKDMVAKEQSAGPAMMHPLLRCVGEAAAYATLLPRRAVVPWRGGGGCYCDFLVEGEGQEEAMQRLQELVGLAAVDGAAFECIEAAATAAARPVGRHPSSGTLLQSCNVAALGAAAGAALLAAAVGYFSLQ